MWNNLSKVFRYVNDDGREIVFDLEHGFLINKPQGIDSVSVQLTQAQGIEQIGATVQSKNVQPRPIVFTGRLMGHNQGYLKDLLLEVIRPDINGTLYADDFFLHVSPTAAPEIGPEKRSADFAFSFLAPYPFWQAQTKKQTFLSGLTARFKFPCNFSRTYQFAEAVDQRLFVLKNTGQLPAPYKVIITTVQSASNFKLTEALSGDFLFMRKQFHPNERVVINNSHDRIEAISSVDGDVTGTLTLDSSLFRLHPGDNVVKPEFETGENATEVFIEYAEEVVGISL